MALRRKETIGREPLAETAAARAVPPAIEIGNEGGVIPATLTQPGATRFWLAVILIGLGAGIGAVALSLLLSAVQSWVWPSTNANILDAAARAGAWRHALVLIGAGVVTGVGQIALVQLSSGNSIEITSAIWFSAGRLPALRTLGSALLSVVIVGMGASLGRASFFPEA